jgi:hypothetical protein
MPSDWIQFCKDYSAKNDIKYSEALKKCSALYNKQGKTKQIKEVEQQLEPEPIPEEKPKSRRRRRKKNTIEMV